MAQDQDSPGRPATPDAGAERKPRPDRQQPGRQPDGQGPMGDAQLTDESAKDKDVDRSRTPGRDYDV